jgi:hypothetical protein
MVVTLIFITSNHIDKEIMIKIYCKKRRRLICNSQRRRTIQSALPEAEPKSPLPLTASKIEIMSAEVEMEGVRQTGAAVEGQQRQQSVPDDASETLYIQNLNESIKTDGQHLPTLELNVGKS